MPPVPEPAACPTHLPQSSITLVSLRRTMAGPPSNSIRLVHGMHAFDRYCSTSSNSATTREAGQAHTLVSQ